MPALTDILGGPSVGRRGSARAALGVLGALLAGCGGAGGAEPAEKAPDPPAVEALAARHGELPLVERVHGVVKAANQVAIRPEIEATVVALMARSGEAVEQGQPLVRLDPSSLREQLRQAEASVRLAEAEARQAMARVAELEAQVVRSRALAEEELVSDLALETQEAQLAAAQAGADQARAGVEEAAAAADEQRADLARTVVRAPVAGRLGQRHAEVGMLVDPSTVLFVVGDLDDLVVEIPLTEEMLGRVEEGQPVRIRAAGTGAAPLVGRLARISPFLAASSFSTVGEVDVDNRGGTLRPGTFVTVDVVYGHSEPATLVPAVALWEDPRTGAAGVFVMAADGAAPDGELSAAARPVALRPVELLAAGDGAVAVRGVEPGEWVVTVGQHLLARDGAAAARVRATTWERVERLQSLQREDLLEGFLAKQREIARTRGATPPTHEEYVGGEGN